MTLPHVSLENAKDQSPLQTCFLMDMLVANPALGSLLEWLDAQEVGGRALVFTHWQEVKRVAQAPFIFGASPVDQLQFFTYAARGSEPLIRPSTARGLLEELTSWLSSVEYGPALTRWQTWHRGFKMQAGSVMSHELSMKVSPCWVLRPD